MEVLEYIHTPPTMKPSCCRNLSTSRQGKSHSWPYQTTQQIRIKGNERIWTFLGVEFVFNLHQSQHSQRTAFESCCPSFVLAIQTFGVCTSNIWWRFKKKRSLSRCYLNFRERNAWPIERRMLYRLKLLPKPPEHWSQFLQVWVNSTLYAYKSSN